MFSPHTHSSSVQACLQPQACASSRPRLAMLSMYSWHFPRPLVSRPFLPHQVYVVSQLKLLRPDASLLAAPVSFPSTFRGSFPSHIISGYRNRFYLTHFVHLLFLHNRDKLSFHTRACNHLGDVSQRLLPLPRRAPHTPPSCHLLLLAKAMVFIRWRLHSQHACSLLPERKSGQQGSKSHQYDSRSDARRVRILFDAETGGGPLGKAGP